MSTIDYIDDWAARLRAKLYTQFRDAVTWQAWCNDVLGPQFQDLEDAGQTLLTMLDIEASDGVQLDVIGRIIGQPRNGVDDATYRLYLSARVLANRSTGTVEDIFKVMRALYGQSETMPRYEGGLVKQFAVRVGEVLTRSQALIGAEFLGDAKEAGARGLFEWSEYPGTGTFGFYDGPALATGVVGGVLINRVYVVGGTSGFPGSAYLKLGDEYSGFFYASTTATCFHAAIAAAPPSSHGPGVPVGAFNYSVGATSIGLDQGYYSGAKQA